MSQAAEKRRSAAQRLQQASQSPPQLVIAQLLGALMVVASLSPLSAAEPDVRAAPDTSAEPEAAAEQIQVEASIDREQVLIDQQIVLSVRVIGDGPLPPGRLVLPEIAGAELMILGEEREIVRGRWIYARHYALFPQQTGQLEIPASVYSAWRPGAEGPVAVRSPALTIQVLPAPPLPADSASKSVWLPAQQLTLSEAGANRVRLAPGQVIERMLTLKAVGLRAEALPPLRVPIPFPLRLAEDAPRLWNERGADGVTGYRTERITLSSAEPGLFQLAAVTLDWWNVDSAGWEQAMTPAWQLEVAAFDSSSRRPAPDWRRDQSSDIAATEGTAAPLTAAPEQPWLIAHWTWMLATLGFILTLWLLWRRKQ
ncbi:MAG: hypothetical protein C1943_17980 [Halochromatium sp.]|nr:hypothetical protein [Halochromatium sp.]